MSETLKIYTYPEAVLHQESEPIENIDGELQKLIDNMAETMYAAPGIGLAANQVGISKRLLVYDLSPKDESRNLSVLMNPEIVLAEDEIIHEEACLSVVEFSAPIKRSARVKVKGIDRHGNPLDIEAEGLMAVCLQHEIDHLNGKLILDHISGLKRSLYKKKLKKLLEDR
jgi:peptide deformylase